MRHLRVCLAVIVLAFITLPAFAEDIPNPDSTLLPPRSVPQRRPLRPIPDWLQTNLRI